MSSNLVVPFDFNPSSFDMESSYTIPAGKYAYVVPIETDCQIDSDSIFEISSGQHDVAGGSNVLIDVPAGCVITDFTAVNISANTSAITIKTIDSASNEVTIASATQDTSLDSYSGSASSQTVVQVELENTTGGSTCRFEYNVYRIPFGQGYWVPTGTVLNGRFAVSEYNVIT